MARRLPPQAAPRAAIASASGLAVCLRGLAQEAASCGLSTAAESIRFAAAAVEAEAGFILSPSPSPARVLQ